MNDLGLFDALRRFDEEYIPFPPFEAAAKMIEDNLSIYRETGIAQHLLILGESGTGKSSLCFWITQKYQRFSLPDREVLPVLYVAVPPAATIASMVEVILQRLGDPSPTTGTASAKTARSVLLCRACRVELILLDEAQHIHDRGLATTHYMVGDWLKSLIDQIGIPTVFLGLPRLEQLLRVNEQLRRRFSRRIRMALGQSDSETIHSECLQLFISLGACLPVPLSSGAYGWDELGTRLYYASNGRVSYIKKLLACALKRCLETQSSEIGPEILEKAFTDELWWEGIGKLNPFNPGFEFRHLDRGNEPFECSSPKANRSCGRKKLIPLAVFPVRPVKSQQESLGGYVRRCYWENGHEMLAPLSDMLMRLYRGQNTDTVFSLIADILPSLDQVSRTWWVTHRFDVVPQGGKRLGWLRFHYPGVRYCPLCLEKDGIHRELWTMPLAVACPRHQCELVKQCYACGRGLTWGRIKPGWHCVCGANLVHAPALSSVGWTTRLAGLLEEALNFEEVFEQIDACSQIYGFLAWAQELRLRLGQKPEIDHDPTRITRPGVRANSVPGSWEESLFMVSGALGERRIRALLRRNFLGEQRTQSLFEDRGPLMLALEASSKLAKNRYSSPLLKSAEALLAKCCSGSKLPVRNDGGPAC